mmetsp:Transcript_70360/g.182452  ORF Transcript_70360/g.182452 Transcript_70360/m.182452 type:complete len:133 (-) Transcript_70360:18-416(-)
MPSCSISATENLACFRAGFLVTVAYVKFALTRTSMQHMCLVATPAAMGAWKRICNELDSFATSAGIPRPLSNAFSLIGAPKDKGVSNEFVRRSSSGFPTRVNLEDSCSLPPLPREPDILHLNSMKRFVKIAR